MTKKFLPVALVLFVFYRMPADAATLSPAPAPKPHKAAVPAAPAKAPPAPNLPPAQLPSLNITSPNGGEKWVIGRQQSITWTTNLSGYCMVELYRGSTSPQTRLGMIGSAVQINSKILTWKAGSYDDKTAPPGNDYWIVIKSEATAKNDASNGPFSLVSITASPSAATPLLSAGKIRSAGSKELSASPGAATPLLSAEKIRDTGSKELSVSSTARELSIIPTLRVFVPGAGDRAIGDTIAVTWTTAVSCSGNGGPLDDGFRVELMDAQGNTKIQDLTDVGYVADSDGTTGYVNWHWDWKVVRGSCNPGLYTIKVTSMISPTTCYDTSKQIRIYDPQAPAETPPTIESVTLTPQFTNRKHCNAELYDTSSAEPVCPQFPDVPPGQGQVGSVSNYRDLGGSIFAQEYSYDYTQFRSSIYFPIDQVPTHNRTLKYANLHLEVKMIKTSGYGGNYQFCANTLYRLSRPWEKFADLFVDPAGTAVPYNKSVVNIQVTSIVKDWLSGAWPNHGFLLTNLTVPPASPSQHREACWTYYSALLYLEFEKTE